MYRAGVSTELVLCSRDWKMKKELRKSDVDERLARLLIPKDFVTNHVFPEMGPELVRQVKSGDGMGVVVQDDDTGKKHRLVFRRWTKSSKSYVLNEGWNKLFVRGRGLQVGDEIGMLWLPLHTEPKFIFKVLRRVARGTSNAATWSSH